MRLIRLDEKRDLALKAVVYGCNTNKRLVGSSYMTGIDSGSPKTISFYDALDVIDKMMDDTIEAEPKWIPVTERLPEREKDVLVYDVDNDEMHVWAFFCDADGDGWVDAAGDMRPWLDATHWMPLPKTPEDGGAENA